MIPPLAPPTSVAQNPDTLADRFESGGVADRQEVARQFESMFVSLLLKEMRKSLDGEGLFPGDASDTYGALFDRYLGEHLAQQSAFGISKLIEGQLAAGAE